RQSSRSHFIDNAGQLFIKVVPGSQQKPFILDAFTNTNLEQLEPLVTFRIGLDKEISRAQERNDKQQPGVLRFLFQPPAEQLLAQLEEAILQGVRPLEHPLNIKFGGHRVFEKSFGNAGGVHYPGILLDVQAGEPAIPEKSLPLPAPPLSAKPVPIIPNQTPPIAFL